jgi:lysozyme
MKTSVLGVQAIAQREGRVLHAYRDTRGILTIGVGHTSAAGPPVVVEGMVITAAECDDILSRDLAKFEDAVNAALRTPIAQNRLSQNAFDACVSLAFNIGAPGFIGSSVARDINRSDMQGAADAFLLWDHPPELIGRRRGERAQFLRPDSAAPAMGADAPMNPEAPRGSIAWIQMKLNMAGASPELDVDGDLGPATLAAIKAFQTNRGLVPDGIVGPQTLAALG